VTGGRSGRLEPTLLEQGTGVAAGEPLEPHRLDIAVGRDAVGRLGRQIEPDAVGEERQVRGQALRARAQPAG
jgi:hypothetical protein